MFCFLDFQLTHFQNILVIFGSYCPHGIAHAHVLTSDNISCSQHCIETLHFSAFIIEYATCTVLLHLLCCKKWSCCDPFQITLPDGILPRWAHSATVIILCPGLVEVIEFGGSSDDVVVGKPSKSYSRLAETTIFSFGEFVFCCCCVPVTLVNCLSTFYM